MTTYFCFGFHTFHQLFKNANKSILWQTLPKYEIEFDYHYNLAIYIKDECVKKDSEMFELNYRQDTFLRQEGHTKWFLHLLIPPFINIKQNFEVILHFMKNLRLHNV